MSAPLAVTAPDAGWRAQLDLRFARQGVRSVLAARRHYGPLHVQRPFYPEGDAVCHVYLLHPPGGVVGGDRLTINIDVEAGAHALVTTPAAAKFYRTAGPMAQQQQHIRVAAGASMEWLPQETLVFSQARVDSLTRVELQGDAAFAGWEILCLGRPASGDDFASGSLRQRFELWRDGAPLWLERGQYAGGAPLMTAPWGLAGLPVSASLVVTGAADGLVEQIRKAVCVNAGEHFSVTQLKEVLVCRYLGHQALRARDVLADAWAVIRPQRLQRPACAPRIWKT